MPSLFTINSSVIALLISKNAKVSDNYIFKSSGTITVNESDFKRLLYVIDKTSERILYTPYKEGSSNTNNQNINLNYDTKGLSDNDELLVIYEAKENNQESFLLNCLINEIKITNKYLRKIYEPKG